MAVSPVYMLENPVEFRAPPPSPIASGRRSSFTNDDVLTEFLEHSLKVPDLVLPDKVFPKQKFIENPPRIDFLALDSPESDVTPQILDAIATAGCFQLVNHGISRDLVKPAMSGATGLFLVPQERRAVVAHSPEKHYGFEEVHGEDENEEFVWCKDRNLKLEMERIWPDGYSNFSERMEALMNNVEMIGKKILVFLNQNFPGKSVLGERGQESCVGSMCYVYKHKGKNWDDGSLRYDVIRMLIRGFDYQHALCLHMCDGSSEFHVYSKKGWVSFFPDPDSLIITVGDQIQAMSGGKYKQVVGRPIFKGEKEDSVSMAFLYPAAQSKSSHYKREKTVSLSHQALFALFLTLVYHFLVYMFKKHSNFF